MWFYCKYLVKCRLIGWGELLNLRRFVGIVRWYNGESFFCWVGLLSVRKSLFIWGVGEWI